MEIRKGYWVVSSRTRNYDADDNPTSDWTEWSHESREVNHLLVKGDRKPTPENSRKDFYDYSNPPRRDFSEHLTVWLEEVYQPWFKSRPLVGYQLKEHKVLRASILIEEME